MGEELPGRAGERQLRIGVIGAGFVGAVHARAARRAGARVAGVSASTAASTARAAQRLGADRGFASGEALATAPGIDVVHICTPNHLHRPLAEAAIAAGKHVICEKPLATDLDGADHLHSIASDAGVVATVPFVYRFYPMVREARARLGEGFGPVRLLHGSYLQDWLSTEHDDNWRVDAELSGPSRAFADIGSHWCDLVEFVTGDRIDSVCAKLVTALAERAAHDEPVHAFESGRDDRRPATGKPVTTEDVALVLFTTGRGTPGSVVVSQISSGHKNQLRFEVAGPQATLAFDQEQPEHLWVGQRRASEVVSRDRAHLDPSAGAYAIVPPGHPQGYQDCFDAFVADTYRAVNAGSAGSIDGLPTFADGARAALITDAVLRSAAGRSWEPVTAAAPASSTQTSPRENRGPSS
jgi:predicted dehydrogenase